MYKEVILLAVMAVWTLADLTCRDYVPKSWKNNKVAITIRSGYDPENYPRSYPYLPSNASVGNPWTVADQSSLGAKFHLRTCNSTSLGVSSFMQSAGSDGGCARTFYDYLQVINPSTGHCLTIRDWNSSVSNLYFTHCGINNKNTSQLWFASQEVDYDFYCKKVRAYGGVDLNIVQKGQPFEAEYPYFALWIRETDNKTLQIIESEYTGRGVYMTLDKVKQSLYKHHLGHG